MSILRKLIQLRNRRIRAKSLGFSFKRAASFMPPSKVNLLNSSIMLNFPNEIGVTNDFLSIFLDDDYHLERVTWPVSTILDIGANLGFFSIAARQHFPKAVIHSYEPNIDLEDYLKQHSEQARFKLHYEAIGLNSGMVSLDQRGETNQTRSKVDEQGKVKQVAFRETIQRLGGKVDFAKIDCEGAEWDFLEDQDSWQNIKFVAMEYHLWAGNKKHGDIQVLLQNLGFQILNLVPISDYGLVYAIR